MVGNKSLSHAWGTDEEGIFVFFSSHKLSSSAAQGSCKASVQSHSQSSRQHRRSTEGYGCYFSRRYDGLFLASPSLSPATHLRRHTDPAKMNVHVYIYGYRCIKTEGQVGVRFISALCHPLMPSLSVNISRQLCQGFM